MVRIIHFKFLFATLIVFLPFFALSATTIKGKAINTKGQFLPYATVFLEGTTIGTTTNEKGYYELNVKPGLYKVICQSMGYKQASFNVEMLANTTVEHVFTLEEQSFEMHEVVVHSNVEDPAYEIIRNAINRRQFHLDQIKSFQTSIYLKVTGRSRNLPDKFMGQKVKTPDLDVDSLGRGILYLAEEHADYYKQDKKQQTIIHSVRESGNANGLGLAQMPPVVTFYDNTIKLFSSRGSISPISDNALFYYKYKLLGQFVEQGHTIYKIDVKQKRKFEPCFNGTIYIVDSVWAIHSIDLTLDKESGIELFDTIRTQQFYLPKNKDEWIIKSQLFYLAAKIFAFDITANAVTVYDNQFINKKIPDSVFNKKIVSIYDTNATKKDTTYWTQIRPVPLVSDEKKNFIVQDSMNKIVENPHYLDSVRRKQNRKLNPIGLFMSGKTFNDSGYFNKYSFSSLLFAINFNTIEGLNIAPAFTWKHKIDTGKSLNFVVSPRYGFSNTHFNTIARLFYTTQDKHWRGRTWLMGISGGKYAFQYNPDNSILPIFNTFTSLVFKENDLKLYERQEGAVFINRNYGNGFSWYAKASYQNRFPLVNTTSYSFDKSKVDSYSSNLPANLSKISTWEQHNAALFNFSMSYKPGVRYIQNPNYKYPLAGKYPLFSFYYDKGVSGIFESKTNFDKIKFTVSDDMPLKLLGTFSYRLSGGGFLNANYVSLPDLNHLFGGVGSIGFASPYLISFQNAPFYAYSNKEPLFGEAHFEYKMKGLLSNKLPVFRQTKLFFIIGSNLFFANSNLHYYETFFSIDNLGFKKMRLFRLDFVNSWDNNNIQHFAIRLGMSGNNITFNATGNDGTKSEW